MDFVLKHKGRTRIAYSFLKSFNLPWPLADIEITKKGMALRVLWKKYYFEKTSIVGVKRYNASRYIKGIQIVHTKTGCPPIIALFSSQREYLIKQLGQIGYMELEGIASIAED